MVLIFRRIYIYSTIEATFLYCGCGRVVYFAGHKAKRLVLQCINGVSSNPIEGRTKYCQLKDLVLRPLSLIFRRIYIYYTINLVTIFNFLIFDWWKCCSVVMYMQHREGVQHFIFLTSDLRKFSRMSFSVLVQSTHINVRNIYIHACSIK